jgi:hypothetical protein
MLGLKQGKPILTAALAGMLMGNLPPAWAATFWDPYIPPEVAFADHLRQKVTIPAAININQGGLSQLKVLPGVDEDIALKVMRNRPFVDIQDFYSKLPGLDKKRIDRLIEQVKPHLIFK